MLEEIEGTKIYPFHFEDMLHGIEDHLGCITAVCIGTESSSCLAAEICFLAEKEKGFHDGRHRPMVRGSADNVAIVSL